MAIQHVYSQTVADGTATSVVRPSDWNSNHKIVYDLSGNTAGSAAISGQNITLVGSNNITLSADTLNSKLVFNAAGGIAGAAGTQTATSGTVVFSNSNNVTFGMSGSTRVTASVDAVPTASTSAIATRISVGASELINTHPVFTNTSFAVTGAGFAPVYAAGRLKVGVDDGVVHLSVPSLIFNCVNTTGGSQVVTPDDNNSIRLNDGNGVSWSSNGVAGIIASVKTDYQSSNANYLTSQSNQAFSASGGSSAFQTLNFANSNGVTFSNTNGSVRVTHDLASSNHSHGMVTTTTNGSLVTVAGNSGGYTLAVPPFLTAAAGGGGIALANSQTTYTSGTAQLSVAGGAMTIASSTGQVFRFSVPATSSLAAGANVTLSTNGSTITIIAQASNAAAPNIRWVNSPFPVSNNLITHLSALTQRPIFTPFMVPGNLTADELMFPVSRAATGSNHFTIHVGLYSYANSTSINLINSSSASYSATSTAAGSGLRMLEFPMGANMSTMTPGNYVLGVIFSNTATASMNYSMMGHSTANPVIGGIHAGADTYWTHTSHGQMPMWGRYTTTTGALPSAVGASNLIGALTGASLPLPWAFTIGADY